MNPFLHDSNKHSRIRFEDTRRLGVVLVLMSNTMRSSLVSIYEFEFGAHNHVRLFCACEPTGGVL